MTQLITAQIIQALTDAGLTEVETLIQAERKDRAQRRKRETLAKIKELAKSIEVESK